MTPQERQLIAGLFDRLAKLESAPRDRDAERAIAQGLAQAPSAVYALVQTVLVQEEALRRADARIRELSGQNGEDGQDDNEEGTGFLDSMRSMFGGGGEQRRGSVPSVRAGIRGEDARRAGAAPTGFQGGSFLGTAAASAAGVIGGALLLDSFRSMFGQGGGQQQGQSLAQSDGNNDLAREAGVNDVGRESGNDQRAGLYDDNNDDGDQNFADADFGGDFGGDA